LVGKSEEKRPLERPRRRWEDTVEVNPKETGYEAENFLTNLASINFSRGFLLHEVNYFTLPRSAFLADIKMRASYQLHSLDIFGNYLFRLGPAE
jgi:hypothetical protein